MSDYFLADDLSGALDAAAAFHRAGRSVVVALTVEAWPEDAADAIVGITTETRNVSPARAAEKVSSLMARARAKGARLVYKKVDSTLRGPVAAELAALAAALPEARLLFVPANPSVGRTVRAGRLLVHGVPVAETEFARDPLSPVRESSIRALLGNAAGPRVTIADAETDADLAAAVRDMEALREPWVAIGSGALARPVAALRPGGRTVSAHAGEVPLPRGPMVFVGGSAHRANREQAERLTQACGVAACEVGPDNIESVLPAAIAAVRQQGAVSLLLTRTRTDSARALAAITEVAGEVVQQTGAARIFATGGETAFALCRALRIARLHFRAEIEPGLSLSRAERPQGAMLWAVKPGEFGDAETWCRAYATLRERTTC